MYIGWPSLKTEKLKRAAIREIVITFIRNLST